MLFRSVEVQVRTRLQHEWAEIFEKLADLLGRGIRYGEPPAQRLAETERAQLSPELQELYETSYALRETSLDLALVVANFIDAVEQGEQNSPHDPDLPEYRQSVAAAIADLRRTVVALEEAGRTAAEIVSRPDQP